ncbi:MAG: hypothetical protein R3E79_56880 [Caldilineaceae bacterium]
MQTEELTTAPEMAMADALPQAENNLRRLSNARPDNWTNPQPTPVYNLIGSGGGSAGLLRRLWPPAWAAKWP